MLLADSDSYKKVGAKLHRPFCCEVHPPLSSQRKQPDIVNGLGGGNNLGQANQKRSSLKNMVASAPRCVYCSSMPTTIEHMPPRMMFNGKSRPSGLEFPCCYDCNNKTRGADAVAAILSRISKSGPAEFWYSRAGRDLNAAFERDAPLAHREFMQLPKRDVLLKNTAGILLKSVEMRVDGENLVRHMNVFSAKIAMALFYEHTGSALPNEGIVQAAWYTNHGLSERHAAAMLQILPGQGELKQGKFTVWDQFAYRFNTDKKTITAGLVGLHKNLHIFFFATSTPAKYGLPISGVLDPVTGFVAKSGQIVGMLGH